MLSVKVQEILTDSLVSQFNGLEVGSRIQACLVKPLNCLHPDRPYKGGE